MLGSMVYNYLSKSFTQTDGLEREKFDAEKFLTNPTDYSFFLDFDYLINCIGIIKPYCKDNDPEGVKKAIRINALFPHELAKFCRGSNIKIIQIATDCVFSGRDGNYDEDSPHDALDVYGKTKSLGEVLAGNFLNVRCSVVGPELKNNLGLLGWFLTQSKKSKLKGFINHKWNGVTTLQFAQLCQKIMENDTFYRLIKTSNVFHFCPNNTQTKYDLLLLFNKVFGKEAEIEKAEAPEPKDLTLTTKYSLDDLVEKTAIEQALIKLRSYMSNSEIFKY